MPRPIVAIVGRPNVGKSALFNRLIGERRAIVEDVPGTTRDRIYGEVEWQDVWFTLVDTGGLQDEDELERSTTAEISRSTQDQAILALEEADVILFVTDGLYGMSAGDMEVADLLRRTEKPVIVVVNKAESLERQDNAVEFYALGLDEPVPVSAIHGMGMGDLLDRIIADIPDRSGEEEGEHPRIALVGRPNVGKSALLNSLLGQGRQIVSDIPGTTRDAVDTPLMYKSQPITLVDTAGVRRRGRIERGIEKYSVLRSMRAIDRADVAVLVLDATEPFTAQDTHIAGYIEERKKGIVLVINKWDLVEKDDRTVGRFVERARETFDFVPYAPIVFTSAETGQRVTQIIDVALTVIAERTRRVPTGELNRLIKDLINRHPPASRPGKWVKFYYATQAAVEPPTFVIFTNEPENVHFSYRRYIENNLREEYGFLGTPIVLRFRKRQGRD
jgi:GTPase